MSDPQNHADMDMENLCEICGDIGFVNAIRVCSLCKSRREHAYCMRILLEPDVTWICEDCESAKLRISKPVTMNLVAYSDSDSGSHGTPQNFNETEVQGKMEECKFQSTSTKEVVGRRLRRKTSRTMVIDKEKVIGEGKRRKLSKKTVDCVISNEAEEVMDVIDVDSGNVKFINRMSPNGLCTMIPVLSPDKQQAIRDIGFGSMLDCKVTSIPLNLGKWLMNHFDPYSTSLILPSGERIKITEKDVYLTLGLPLGGDRVDEAEARRDNNCDEEFSAVLDEFRRYWGIVKSAPIPTQMTRRLIEDKDFGDMFKRNFIVFFVSTFLSGNQHGWANVYILKALVNTETISKLNWCGYTLKKLIESAIYWREKGKKSFFTGPLFFLMMFYVDRVVFKWRTVRRCFPTFSSWTYADIKQRVNDELKSGGFGRGSVEAEFVLEEKKEEKKEAIEVENKLGSEAEKKRDCDFLNKDVIKNFMKSVGMRGFSESSEEDMVEIFTFICKKLIGVLSEFNCMMDLASAQYPNSLGIRRVIEGLVCMACGLRDKFLKNSVKTDEDMSRFSQDDEFYKDPRLHAVIDAMFDFNWELKREAENSGEDKTKGDDFFSAPSFDLGVDLTCIRDTFEKFVKEKNDLDVDVNDEGEVKKEGVKSRTM